MKRILPGLSQADSSAGDQLPDGLYLVRVVRAHYRWHPQKPYYLIHFSVLEPRPVMGAAITGRIYSTAKALWKLNWFLRDFSYDPDLIERDEIDDQQLVGLTGVIKISHQVVNGTSLVNLEGFAPASHWYELTVNQSSHSPAVARPAAKSSSARREPARPGKAS